MFAYELQRRLAGTNSISVAAHPGGANSELSRYQSWLVKTIFSLLSQDVAIGALPTLRSATDPDASGGQHYGPSKLQQMRGYPILCKSGAQYHDVAAGKRL